MMGSNPKVYGTQTSHRSPVTLGGQIHWPVTGWQNAVDGQSHSLQFGKPKYPVLHCEQVRPITLGLHWHWPPNSAHS